MKLYRAAKDDYVDTGYSFAETLDAAREYLNNPGFGGARLFVSDVKVKKSQVLDLTGMDTTEVAETLGVSDPGAIGVDEWLPRDPEILDVIRGRGFRWAKVDESFPSGTTTWIWTGTFDDDEPELVEVSSGGKRRHAKTSLSSLNRSVRGLLR